MTRIDSALLGGAVLALLAGVAAVFLLAGGTLPATAAPLLVDPLESASPEPTETAGPEMPEELVVDVEGAVQRPGLQSLPVGARVGDAIAAAGGYSAEADLGTAARQLNLAQPLADGQQVYVAALGDEPVTPIGGASTPTGDGSPPGPINVNTATPEQLDSLPGIGPVTVQKIVAGREERPFASLDEMVERKVLNRGQLEKIRDLAGTQ